LRNASALIETVFLDQKVWSEAQLGRKAVGTVFGCLLPRSSNTEANLAK